MTPPTPDAKPMSGVRRFSVTLRAWPTPLMRRWHQARIFFENIRPAVEGGRYPVKREVGDRLVVEADVFREGHDILSVSLLYRHENEHTWHEVPMQSLGNDCWRGEFLLEQLGEYWYTLAAWTDTFGSWLQGVLRKVADGQQVRSDLLEGAYWLEQTAQALLSQHALAIHPQATEINPVPPSLPASLDPPVGKTTGEPAPPPTNKLANAPIAEELLRVADQIRNLPEAEAVSLLQQPRLAELMRSWQPRVHYCVHQPPLRVVVDRVLARFAAWYELFPRSASPVPGRHGTFRDVMALLPELHELGFDVLYFPPIHPVGRTYRKGKNNSPIASPDDPGSPWAVGNELGGHTAIEPQLGTLEEFRELVQAARRFGMEIALDLAVHCSPDHPYVREHPHWFRHRPDGTIKYAENPPKKYQDIYPIDFDSQAWPEIWYEWRRVLRFWIEQGVYIFRVDNPHTKPIRFWQWLIREIKREHPQVIFLSEAFTRPKIMKALAKVGFSQSYTYFAWRNTRQELVEYLTELTQTDMAEYFRPSFWPNTPDILTEYLQTGGRPAFKIRFILAATLSPLYGIYSGYEFCENTPLRPGSEEYLNSEKYEIKWRDRNAPGNIKDFIARVNHTRRQHPALHYLRNLRFHDTTNDQLLCYSKATPDFRDVVIVVVNLDPHRAQEGLTRLRMADLGLPEDASFAVHDVLTDSLWHWRGSQNYVRLDPHHEPAHLLVVRCS